MLFAQSLKNICSSGPIQSLKFVPGYKKKKKKRKSRKFSFQDGKLTRRPTRNRFANGFCSVPRPHGPFKCFKRYKKPVLFGHEASEIPTSDLQHWGSPVFDLRSRKSLIDYSSTFFISVPFSTSKI